MTGHSNGKTAIKEREGPLSLVIWAPWMEEGNGPLWPTTGHSIRNGSPFPTGGNRAKPTLAGPAILRASVGKSRLRKDQPLP